MEEVVKQFYGSRLAIKISVTVFHTATAAQGEINIFSSIARLVARVIVAAFGHVNDFAEQFLDRLLLDVQHNVELWSVTYVACQM